MTQANEHHAGDLSKALRGAIAASMIFDRIFHSADPHAEVDALLRESEEVGPGESEEDEL
jgi:hypothetical protein